jgi:outer membrane protein assembly factor BamB
MKRLAQKIFAPALSLLLLFSAASPPSFAAGRDRGVMRVEFLYSIESAGGRGERLRDPMDIFFDRRSRELYVADAGAGAVHVFNADGGYLDKIDIDRKTGSPTMVATDAEGRLYVGHNRSSRVSVLTFRGELIGSYELPGIVDAPGNSVRPSFFTQGADGEVVALKSKGGLVRVDPDGERHREWELEWELGGEDSPNKIYGMTVDAEGRYLFSDMRPYSVVIYDPRQETFRRFGSAGVLYGQIARPQGLAADETGHIFVTSLVRNKVLCYDAEGNFIEEFGGIGRGYGHFYMPTRIVSDGRDRIYVLEPTLKRIQVFRIGFPHENRLTATTKIVNES